MIVSENKNRATSRWLQVCTLLCAVVVLPLGLAGAQDYEAIGKRLKKAVKKGEITEKQAYAMMGTLKKTGKGEHAHKKSDHALKGHDEKLHEHKSKLHQKGHDHKQGAHDHHKKVDIDAIRNKIQAAIQAGKLTNEQGRAKMAAVKKAAAHKHGDHKKVNIDATSRKIREAVAVGKITKEQGRAKINVKKEIARKEAAAKKAVRKKAADLDRREGSNWGARKQRIEDAVKAGKMTRKEANKAHEGLRKRMAHEHEGASETFFYDAFERAAIEIRKAIAEGKVSEEHGKILFGEVRKLKAKQAKSGVKRIERPSWEGISKRIEAALKAGEITREEANAKHDTIRRGWAEKGERSKQGAKRDDEEERRTRQRDGE